MGIAFASRSAGGTMAKDTRESSRSILGDINPQPVQPGQSDAVGRVEEIDRSIENESSMDGGSQHDRTEHSGSRDVTEGTTGGTEPEVGGTRNYRQGTGVTGTDIGHRPE